MSEIGGVANRLRIYFDNHISRVESGLVSPASLFDRAHKHAAAVLDAEELPELRSDVFDHQSAAHGGVRDDDRDGQIEIRHDRNVWHLDIDVAGIECHHLAAISKLHLERQRLSSAAQTERDDATTGGFTNHAPQLCSTFDRRAIQGENDVVLLQSGLAGGSILIDHRHLGALLFLEFESAQAF